MRNETRVTRQTFGKTILTNRLQNISTKGEGDVEIFKIEDVREAFSYELVNISSRGWGFI